MNSFTITPEIVERLLTTDATIKQVAAELGIPGERLRNAYCRVTTAEQREASRIRKMRRFKPARRAEADAAQICQRLLDGESFKTLLREYGCCSEVLSGIYQAGTTKEQRETARRAKLRHRNLTQGVGWQKGMTPWNTGMKGLHLCPSHEFKKGHRMGGAAAKYKPVGTTIVVRRRNRLGRMIEYIRVIKVSDTAPYGRRWIAYARYVWEQAHGLIPRGWRVMHRDGDLLNDDLDNLVCVPAREALRLERARIPGFEQKRVAAAVKGRRKVAAAQREAAALRKLKQRVARKSGEEMVWAWECPECGWDQANGPCRCIKCGATVRRVKVMALAMAGRKADGS